MPWDGSASRKKRTLHLSCEKSAFETYLAGEILFPLVGNDGEILSPVVDKGETVKAGVVVAGEEGHELRCPVSGKIEEITVAPYPTGLRAVPVLRIIPENAQQDEPGIDPSNPTIPKRYGIRSARRDFRLHWRDFPSMPVSHGPMEAIRRRISW